MPSNVNFFAKFFQWIFRVWLGFWRGVALVTGLPALCVLAFMLGLKQGTNPFFKSIMNFKLPKFEFASARASTNFEKVLEPSTMLGGFDSRVEITPPPQAVSQKMKSDMQSQGQSVTPQDKSINEFATNVFSKEDIIADRANRVPETFKVPEVLRERVSFWFDVYTKYGSNTFIFHHSEYPWIVFKVIDTSSVLALPVKTKNPWTPYHRAKKLVDAERKALIKNLASLAHKTNGRKLTSEESRLVDLMGSIPGPRKKVYLAALHNMRSQQGQRDFFKGGLINSAKYLPRMEEIFARYDLPIELTRLPLVESSFNEKAVSKVGASGIWQFMPAVGKSYLHVGDAFDERNAPLKATEAAARLFMLNFRIFKDWPLAITAYNHGAGGLLKATRAMKTRDLIVLIKKYRSPSFQFASTNFYCNYMAALHAERYQNEVFGPLEKVAPLLSDTIKLQFKMKASKVSAVAGMTLEEMRLYNPDLKARKGLDKILLPRGYNLHLPVGRGSRIELFQLEAKDNSRQKERRTKRFSMSPSTRKKKLVTISFENESAPKDL